MKQKFHFTKIHLLILAVVVGLMFSSLYTKQKKHRLLIFTGGHQIDKEAFFDIFEDNENIEYEEIIHPNANLIYNSSAIDDFDVLVFYDMVQEISNPQKKALIKLLEKGKPAIFLHHSLVSYQKWDEFEKIIGGRFFINSSTYSYDVEIPVKIVNKKHPITKGMEDFIIHDEVYGNYKVLPTVKPLLTTTHPENGKIMGWTNKYGKSNIVYIQLGHDHHSYKNPNYRLLIKQSIDWITKE